MRCVQGATVHWRPGWDGHVQDGGGGVPLYSSVSSRFFFTCCCRNCCCCLRYQVLFTAAVAAIVPRSWAEQRVCQQPSRDTGEREGHADHQRPARVGARWVGRRRAGRRRLLLPPLLLLGAVDLRPPALLLVRQRGLHRDVAVDYPDARRRSGAAGDKEGQGSSCAMLSEVQRSWVLYRLSLRPLRKETSKLGRNDVIFRRQNYISGRCRMEVLMTSSSDFILTSNSNFCRPPIRTWRAHSIKITRWLFFYAHICFLLWLRSKRHI